MWLRGLWMERELAIGTMCEAKKNSHKAAGVAVCLRPEG